MLRVVSSVDPPIASRKAFGMEEKKFGIGVSHTGRSEGQRYWCFFVCFHTTPSDGCLDRPRNDRALTRRLELVPNSNSFFSVC